MVRNANVRADVADRKPMKSIGVIFSPRWGVGHGGGDDRRSAWAEWLQKQLVARGTCKAGRRP